MPGRTTLFVEVVQDAAGLGAQEEVAVHDDDSLLAAVSPSVAHSVAAHLLAAADVAAGLR